MIKQHFPSFEPFTETFFLTCLLHDIGTTDKNLKATKLSFEFYGGILALQLLSSKLGAPQSQAESVAETIIRHQDLGETGTISSLCALIHLVTIFGTVIPIPFVVAQIGPLKRGEWAFNLCGWCTYGCRPPTRFSPVSTFPHHC